ncbi:hypothetical protein EVAR_11947_1 [Eumeta japonica]|uniref:Uncharacterized protein n=1 Tax=Eumeta variegata TaxID=151549 RepID=A0A4C1U511_EUMVA|nr:hypothetical protein EVAR_11947_1 [Eumeta japonica]
MCTVVRKMSTLSAIDLTHARPPSDVFSLLLQQFTVNASNDGRRPERVCIMQCTRPRMHGRADRVQVDDTPPPMPAVTEHFNITAVEDIILHRPMYFNIFYLLTLILCF